MPFEKEIKLKIKNTGEIIKRIEEKGAKLIRKRHFEDNFLLDFPDNSLYRRGTALRIRVTEEKNFLTFKGKKRKSSSFKIRDEWETEIKDVKALFMILKNIGLEIKFRYQKFRTIYRKNKLKITIDETPIGNFLELEGEEKEIKDFVNDLGFSEKSFIKMDYVEIFKQSHSGDMVFSE
ncbi:class IV adenylate cyclase [Candidatus Aminicenantes bacterium AC-335-K20]|jgi:adenylate cyclase class 2|nr:class IV adenylate cyclase [SCandidatus Aminicenantes bacterium Aminicenantia_JdfR_composite]MCP2596407.1 class IV adenylate cyclase [Candidatus Aminicenantes bacterium AC-335-G13]MCP2606198.1 class IV adenylate cyclase [Candidatus Aminicenantes bacterium AC-708-I09]MCP2618215.1 class IV adenylate cyclase [Candidatus Aminicenantes bacterium AC-335-A11]MCP2619475.1 class IV adenylate cyclase [Candidatus Aminicenantes bacterium AC-335-K20]